MAGMKDSSSEIAEYIRALNSPDYATVQAARRALVAKGAQVVEALWAARDQADDLLRWEITRTLVEIRDPQVADRLVQILIDDPDPGIRWMAAEGLVSLGEASLRPLLEALVHHSDSAWLRQGAHHVLKALAAGPRESPLRSVLQALESIEPVLQVPRAAQEALVSLGLLR